MKKPFLLILFVAILVIPFFSYAENLNNSAQSYILMDLKSGTVLTEKNADQQLSPASTTKILTAIIAIESGNLDKLATASKNAILDIGNDGMHIGIMEHEEISIFNLVHALLIRSANETANIIAENICPTKKDFIELMNKKAKEYGATNSNFVNPCGKDTDLEDVGHVSTARDLALIAKHGMSLPLFREIVKEKFFKIPPTNKHPNGILFYTTNKLLSKPYKSNIYTAITGIKTGFTNKAGQNLISSAIDKDGMELLAVVMAVKKGNITSFSSSKALLEYGYINFKEVKIFRKDQQFEDLNVINADESNSVIHTTLSNDISFVMPKNSIDIPKYTVKKFVSQTLHAPVTSGTAMGYIECWKDNSCIGRANIIANNSILLKLPQKSPWINYMKYSLIFLISLIVFLTIILFLFRNFTFQINLFSKKITFNISKIFKKIKFIKKRSSSNKNDF